MNEATQSVLTLVTHYRIASELLADVLKARADGKAVAASFDAESGVLSATVPVTRKTAFWSVADLETFLQDRRHRVNDKWARHVNLLLPGARATEINFRELATALLERMRAMLVDGEPEAQPGDLPDALKVDFNAKERADETRARKSSVDFIAELAKRNLLDALFVGVNRVLSAGSGHREEHTDKVVVTPERITIDLKWQHPRDKSNMLSFTADSDVIGDRLSAEWARRNYPDAAPWCSRGYGDDSVSLIRRFEPTSAEFRGIACHILNTMIKTTGLKERTT
jgi:hypothetical protein